MTLRIRYADVAGTLALVVALSGTAYALSLPKNSVGPKQLQRSAVITAKLHNRAVTHAKIAKGAVNLANISGTDLTGTITLSVPGNTCGVADLEVPGAKVGQIPLFILQGDVALPANFILEAVKIPSKGQVRLKSCNVGPGSDSVVSLGIRVVTID